MGRSKLREQAKGDEGESGEGRSQPPPVGSESNAASGGSSEMEIGILKERLRDY